MVPLDGQPCLTCPPKLAELPRCQTAPSPTVYTVKRQFTRDRRAPTPLSHWQKYYKRAEVGWTTRIWLITAFLIGIALSIGDFAVPQAAPFVNNLVSVPGASDTFVVTSTDGLEIKGGELSVGDRVTVIAPTWTSRITGKMLTVRNARSLETLRGRDSFCSRTFSWKYLHSCCSSRAETAKMSRSVEALVALTLERLAVYARPDA